MALAAVLKSKIEGLRSLVPLLFRQSPGNALNFQNSFLWLIYCENIVRNTPGASPVLHYPNTDAADPEFSLFMLKIHVEGDSRGLVCGKYILRGGVLLLP